MANLNKVMLIGRLTRDPELRYTQGGTAVADVGLAVNREWTTQDGQKKKETCFVDCVVWARLAEVVCQYLEKGSEAYFEGRLQLDQWEDREGNKRSKLRVQVESCQFLSYKNDNRGGDESDARSDGAPPV